MRVIGLIHIVTHVRHVICRVYYILSRALAVRIILLLPVYIRQQVMEYIHRNTTMVDTSVQVEDWMPTFGGCSFLHFALKEIFLQVKHTIAKHLIFMRL